MIEQITFECYEIVSKLLNIHANNNNNNNQNHNQNQSELNNIIIDGVSGCGKTSLILKIGNNNLNLKILALTNTINKSHSCQRARQPDARMLTQEDCACHNNVDIYNYKNIDFDKSDYDIIIIDDVQNLMKLNFNKIKKIYNNNEKKAYLYIFGDKYSFINTNINTNTNNINYLLSIEQDFNFNNYSWKYINISKSERINDKIALFVNNCLLLDNVIETTKISNNKPKYYLCDINTKSLLLINDYLNIGYKYDDILILSPSIKTYSIKLLIRNLFKQKISISVNKEDCLNKILILPLCESKEIERKIVIIFNFDSSYLKYYKSVNNLYIGVTRTTEELVLMHHFKYNYLPFFKYSNLEKYCDINKICNISIEAYKVKEMNLNSLSSTIIDKCMEYIEIENVQALEKNAYIIHELNNNVKDYIISKLNISNNAKYEIKKEIIINKYKFNEIIDCIDYNNIYKFIYCENIDNINYISLAIQKYINENKPTNINFELYEKVYYNNEEYIVNKINKGTIEVINLNTSQYETISCDLVYKKNNENENKYYLYNIYTNELNIITCNNNKIYEMINYIINN